MKLEPPIPEDYRLHPDWYGSLTSAAEMSDERLLAEYEYIQKAIADFKARGIYMSDGPYSLELDLWLQVSRRGLDDYVIISNKIMTTGLAGGHDFILFTSFS